MLLAVAAELGIVGEQLREAVVHELEVRVRLLFRRAELPHAGRDLFGGHVDQGSGDVEQEIIEVLDLVTRFDQRLLRGSGIVRSGSHIGEQGLESLYANQSAG